MRHLPQSNHGFIKTYTTGFSDLFGRGVQMLLEHGLNEV
jgi:hypothetical protein